jgi:parallel beta-helix repeat protein
VGAAGPALADPTDPAPSVGTAGPGAGSTDPVTAADTDVTGDRLPYPGDTAREPLFVAQEDRRLLEVDTASSVARWSGLQTKTPYRMATGAAYTLVLTARDAAYTVKDLLRLAPQTFVRQPDGAYLLSEHLIVLPGATLDLSAGGPLTLRMASDGKAFVSIVNNGGRLVATGSADKAVQITSWDRTTGTPDLTTADGRAYVRSVGGHVTLDHVTLSDLGFWSGRTGGLSLTGTDRPNTGQLDEYGRALKVGAVQEGPPAPPTPAPTSAPAASAADAPAGQLALPSDATIPTYSYVSASIHNVSVTRSAFGLFVASATGVDIRNSRFSENLVDGVVLHRYVTNTIIGRSFADHNAGDGFVLARATSGIVMSQASATENHRNGVSVSGLPLATGPSATGTPIASYGNNVVTDSTFADNGRYGVEVVGGTQVTLRGNQLVSNEFGVVVREGATNVSVANNAVSGSRKTGIALLDRVSGATVSDNTVSGGDIGVQSRDSSGVLRHNTLTGSANHGVSVVGAAAGVRIDGNVVTGRGASAIDTLRAVDLDSHAMVNDTEGWQDTTPWPVTLKRFLQPLTLMWLLLGSVVLVTALRGLRRQSRFGHPYASTARLSESTSTGAVR